MSVSSISSNPSAAGVQDGLMSTAARTPKKSLDAGDFIKLLSVQMQNQDPMSPMDNSEQMAQMAQMTSMQSMTQLAQSIAGINASQTQALATSYLGRQVSLVDADGQLVTGQVTAIDAGGATPRLVVGGGYYELSAVTRVELPPAAPTAGS